jgi:hypothetical protein
MMSRARTVFVAAVAVGGALLSAGAANAADGAIPQPSWAEFSPVWGVSGDGVGSQADASGNFKVRIADVNTDGLRAVSWISVLQPDGSWNKRAVIEDADGNNSSYTVFSYNVAVGKKVRLTACVQNGASGSPTGCSTSTWLAK